ncbi:hypothetical protein ACVWZ6_007455 [Bradyrhizobium sp. GM6.1]
MAKTTSSLMLIAFLATASIGAASAQSGGGGGSGGSGGASASSTSGGGHRRCHKPWVGRPWVCRSYKPDGRCIAQPGQSRRRGRGFAWHDGYRHEHRWNGPIERWRAARIDHRRAGRQSRRGDQQRTD